MIHLALTIIRPDRTIRLRLCLNAKSERAILKLLTARSSSAVQPRFRHAPISAEALVSGCSERFLEAG